MIPFVVGGLGMAPKGLAKKLAELEIRRRIDSIQNTALLRSAGILRKAQETGGDFVLFG